MSNLHLSFGPSIGVDKPCMLGNCLNNNLLAAEIWLSSSFSPCLMAMLTLFFIEAVRCVKTLQMLHVSGLFL